MVEIDNRAEKKQLMKETWMLIADYLPCTNLGMSRSNTTERVFTPRFW